MPIEKYNYNFQILKGGAKERGKQHSKFDNVSALPFRQRGSFL